MWPEPWWKMPRRSMPKSYRRWNHPEGKDCNFECFGLAILWRGFPDLVFDFERLSMLEPREEVRLGLEPIQSVSVHHESVEIVVVRWFHFDSDLVEKDSFFVEILALKSSLASFSQIFLHFYNFYLTRSDLTEKSFVFVKERRLRDFRHKINVNVDL